MRIKRKAYISLEVVFLLTIMVISGMYVTIKLFNKGHDVSGQEAEAFSKVNHTVNNAINVGSSGGGGGGGGGGSTPSEPTGVIDTIYWGIDASGKLIISDVEVDTAIDDQHKGNFPGDTVFIEDENTGPTTPWFPYYDSIYSIEVVRNNRKVAPASTAVWFESLENVTNVDVTNLDTNNVTDMYAMFAGCGFNATTFTIVGLDTWDTSNVTDMSVMFVQTGYNAITELDLSRWDASNVTSMIAMFNGIESLQTIKTPKNIPSTVNITDITSSNLWDITDNNKMYTAGTFPVGNGNESHTLSFVMPDDITKTIYWGIDASGKLIISDVEVTTAIDNEHKGNFPYDTVFTLNASYHPTTPWYKYEDSIYSIEVVKINRKVAPISTAYWFQYLHNVSNINVTDLDTSNVQDMSWMFYGCGPNVSSFTITGLDTWNTSNVTNMTHMFDTAGKYVATWAIGDLSGWDVSKVDNMEFMFNYAGFYATTWNIGDLSGWNTSNVIDMGGMFAYAGYKATIFNIGNIGSWDTSNVTDMHMMFASCGYYATEWIIGDISNWNVSNVTNMRSMFWCAGRKVTEELNLSGWDVSKVTDMSYMFDDIENLQTIKTPKNIQASTNITNITSKPFIGSDGKTYPKGTFPRGNTTSITLTAQ